MPPSAEEITRRRALVHTPYHAKLLELIHAKIMRFGRVVLIDAHSVASRANLLHGKLKEHIYLGDRDGRSCAPWLVDAAERGFLESHYTLMRNHPYKGGYITEHYGQLEQVEALQIEMCQRVYMDEDDPAGGVSHPNFTQAKARIRAVLESVRAETLRQRAGW